MTAERFEEIADKLGGSEKTAFKRYYTLANANVVTDKKTFQILKETYTKLDALGEIYILKSSLSALENEKTQTIFQKIGYTEEEREKDHELVGYTDPEGKGVNVILTAEYTLQDCELKVSIPAKEIKATPGLKLESVEIFPYWNSAQKITAVVPDGSGGLMDLSTAVSSSTPGYEEPVYGEDYSDVILNKISNKKGLPLPIYGLMSENGAMYAAARQGAATAFITAAPKTDEKGFGAIGFRFTLLKYAQVKLLPDDKDTVRSYAS